MIKQSFLYLSLKSEIVRRNVLAIQVMAFEDDSTHK